MTAQQPRPSVAVSEIPPPALELRDIEAGYGRTQVLRGVTVEVPAGQVVTLLGANGVGKTTTLRVASGLLRPTHGTVAINGVDVTSRPSHTRTKAGICLIPEGRGIFRSLTVGENLRLQVPPWSRDRDIDRAVEAFPILGKRLNQVAGSLSGGQQQMLALSRAYLASPSVVLVDEASMGLAPLLVDHVFETLRNLAASGVALLIVEQYVNRAIEIADKVVLLDKGSVVFESTPAMLSASDLLRTYLGSEAVDE
jgi:branched-chain amino acid transport system ATP-binding protein